MGSIFLFLVLIVIITGQATAAPGVIVTLENKTVRVGETFTINVTVANPYGLGLAGMQTGLNFDPTVLRYNGARPGMLLSIGGTTFSGETVPKGNYNTGTRYEAILGHRNSTAGGIFVSYNFTALREYSDHSWLIADPLKLSDQNGTLIEIQNYIGNVVVRPKEDANLDGSVDFFDLSLISQSFGEYSKLDQDGDGQITIMDLVQVAQKI